MFFTKMHGLGNDFIVIDGRNLRGVDYSKAAAFLCNRNFGIGADGILVVEDSKVGDSRMRIFNSDGSEAEMCGNGIRCFAKYLYDNKLVTKEVMSIETMDGVKEVYLEIDECMRAKSVRVNMGKPLFSPADIPALLKVDKIIDEPVSIEGYKYHITSMLVGVPHTVVFVEDIDKFDIAGHGRRIEKSNIFPKGTNVNFVQVVSSSDFIVRTWERGAGLTLACGTGTCASLAACALMGFTRREALAHLGGGDMYIEWVESGELYMTGPAVTVFTGEVNYKL